MGETVNLVCAQCTQDERDTFGVTWKKLNSILDNEKLILKDLNGHIRIEENGLKEIQGDWAMVEINGKEERVLNYTQFIYVEICNTFFKKQESKNETFKSGYWES